MEGTQLGAGGEGRQAWRERCMEKTPNKVETWEMQGLWFSKSSWHAAQRKGQEWVVWSWVATVPSRGAPSSPMAPPGPLHLLTAAAYGLQAFAFMPALETRGPLAQVNKFLHPGPCLLHQLLSGPGDQAPASCFHFESHHISLQHQPVVQAARAPVISKHALCWQWVLLPGPARWQPSSRLNPKGDTNPSDRPPQAWIESARAKHGK